MYGKLGTEPGQYVVVSYDGQNYVGIIQETTEDDSQINCMHSVGTNLIKWPRRRDIC